MDSTIIAALIGASATIITAILIIVVKRRKSKLSSEISFEESSQIKNDLKKITRKISLPAELLKSKVLNERVEAFHDKFFSHSMYSLSQPIEQSPELLLAFSNARAKYAQWGEKIDIDLLISLLIERLKAFNQTDEIYYDQALNKIDLITSNQLRFMTLHQVAFGLYDFLLVQDQNDLPNLSNLMDYLSFEFSIVSSDIDHLTSLGFITDMSPYRYPEINLEKAGNEVLKDIKTVIDKKLSNLTNLNLWSYKLSPVSKIITSLNIKGIVKSENIGFVYPERELADFYVKNLYATAEVEAFSKPDSKNQ